MLGEKFQDIFISICHVLQVEIVPAPGVGRKKSINKRSQYVDNLCQQVHQGISYSWVLDAGQQTTDGCTR